jgi:hypothetical protein
MCRRRTAMEAMMPTDTNNAAVPMQLRSETIIWRPGDPTRKDAFFILLINNPALERPWNSGNFVPAW